MDSTTVQTITISPQFGLRGRSEYTQCSGEDGRLDRKTKVRWKAAKEVPGDGGGGGGGSWMLAKKKTAGRKEGILQGRSGGTPNAIHVPTAFKY